MNPYFQFIPSYQTTIFFPRLPIILEQIIFKMKDEMEYAEKQQRIVLEFYRRNKIERIHQFIKLYHRYYSNNYSIRYLNHLTSKMWWVGKELSDDFWKNFKEDSFWNPIRTYQLEDRNYFSNYKNSILYQI